MPPAEIVMTSASESHALHRSAGCGPGGSPVPCGAMLSSKSGRNEAAMLRLVLDLGPVFNGMVPSTVRAPARAGDGDRAHPPEPSRIYHTTAPATVGVRAPFGDARVGDDRARPLLARHPGDAGGSGGTDRGAGVRGIGRAGEPALA